MDVDTGNLDCLRLLVQKGADITKRNAYSNTPTGSAVAAGCIVPPHSSTILSTPSLSSPLFVQATLTASDI